MYGEPLTWFQRFMLRFQPTPMGMAKAELKQAELAVLHCTSKAEYYNLRKDTAALTAAYHLNRADRLRQYLGYDQPGPMAPYEDPHIEFKTKY